MKMPTTTTRVLLSVIAFLLASVVLTMLRTRFVISEPLFIAALLAAALLFVLIIGRSLSEPLRRMRAGLDPDLLPEDSPEGGIDGFIDVVNEVLATAKRKNLQTDTLHRIAVSLNQDMTFDEIMDTIGEESRLLVDAELSAIALYDDKGRFDRIRCYGVAERLRKRLGRMTGTEGLLALVRLSLVPVRINNVVEHPAYSGRLPEGHPPIRNFLGYPIFSKDGRPLAALFFANKRGGEFSGEDEKVLTAIASDAAVAIQRVHETVELERFKKIIDSAFDMIVITDSDGNISYVNPAAERITGFTPEEIIRENASIMKSGLHDEEFCRNFWESILAGRPWKGECVDRRKNGEPYSTSAVIFPIYSDSGEIMNFVSIQRDITEEKKLYDQLLRSQKMEALGTLAGGIAHDFNNILTAVLGYAEIMKGQMDEDDPLYKCVDIIEKSAQRGALLAEKMVSVTRKEKLKLQVVDINAIIRETFEILNRSIPKEVSIELDLAEGLPRMKADPAQIQQVIMNLAINAKDAMPDGGVMRIETRMAGGEAGISEGISFEGDFVKLSVSDTGRGIEKELQDRVFDPFFTTKETGKGTGLGLYIVHSIVTNHGGYISLYSEPGRGTVFNIYLPVFGGEAEEDTAIRDEDLSGSGTVLVIDDEEVIRELSRDILEPLGYRVVTAENGSEGVEVFTRMRREISVVLLDMVMPRMNGAETFRRLKGIEPDVRVVLCSGYTHEGLASIKGLLDSGARGFVQKPFSKLALARALKRALS